MPTKASQPEVAESGPAEEPVEPASDARAHHGTDRQLLLWGVPGAIALLALGSYLGYLAKPLSPSPSHTGLIQGLELSGALFCGVLLVCLLILYVQEVRPAKPAAEQKEAAEEDKEAKEPEETPYDFRADQRQRHRTLIWAVPVTLVIAAVGAVFGYLGIPGVSNPHQSFAGKLAVGCTGLLGLFTLGFVGLCFYPAWPAPVYGPKRAPRPWVLPLKLAGCWLAMFPFSLFSLGAIGIGIYQGVNGAWVKMIVLLTIGLMFGVACCFLLAGSGALRGEQLKPGGEVPKSVRKTKWWGRFRLMLTLWALLMTAVAIAFAVQGSWDNCADFGGTALGSWIARLKAGSGEMPQETFQP